MEPPYESLRVLSRTPWRAKTAVPPVRQRGRTCRERARSISQIALAEAWGLPSHLLVSDPSGRAKERRKVATQQTSGASDVCSWKVLGSFWFFSLDFFESTNVGALRRLLLEGFGFFGVLRCMLVASWGVLGSIFERLRVSLDVLGASLGVLGASHGVARPLFGKSARAHGVARRLF